MIYYEPGDIVIYNTIALAGYDVRVAWIDEETIGMVVKRFEFGENACDRAWFNKNKPDIQFPKFVYTLLSLGETIEVLDIDILRKI